MRTSLLFIFLNIGISVIIKAYALQIVLRIVAIRNWLYRAFTSEEGKADSEDMLANLPDEIADYRLLGNPNEVIAAKILLRLVRGLPGDLAIWAPPILALFAGKIAGWSDTLRHYKVPNAMITGVGTLGLINYALFSSPSNRTFGTWLLANTVGIATILLLWKYRHPLARRILHAWMGLGIAAGLILMMWMTIQYHLYETMTFKILMLAMVAALPAIVVVDKPWRKRLFGGRWWLITLCWTLIVTGAFVGSLLIAHDIKPILEVWAAMGLLVVGLLIVGGATAFVAYILCWLGIRGGASGLQLMASGIRRLR